MGGRVSRILVISSIVVVLTAHRSMGQQGQISLNRNGVQQNYVIGPDGTYRVNDDGSLQQVDPASEPALQGLSIPNTASSGGSNVGSAANFPLGKGNGSAGSSFSGGNGNSGVGMVMSPQQMQQRIRQMSDDSLKKALGCSDQEWAALLPMIHKIQALQVAVMPGSRLKAPPRDADAPTSVDQLAQHVEEFEKYLSGNDVPDEILVHELASVREARDNVRADLVQARKELTAVVTHRQEAILFDRGILAD
jgi:hypothetical protein